MEIGDRMARSAANLLQGTTLKVEDLGHDYATIWTNNEAFNRTLGTLIFRCESCGHWEDRVNDHGDDLCASCGAGEWGDF